MSEQKVILIAGGGKIYADVAARFCRSEKPIEEIIESPYSPKIIQNLLSSGHLAALEFDYFLFAVEGFSRVCETQLVRKRMASYMIKSGREELGGKRKFDVYLPNDIKDFYIDYTGNIPNPYQDIDGDYVSEVTIRLNADDICKIIEQWYSEGVKLGKPEEDLRYMKPQGTTFKAIIGMNIHSLYDFFGQRLCKRAQSEIRKLATMMYKEAVKVAPDIFKGVGAKCVNLGYCPENARQAESCKGRIPTKKEMMELKERYWRSNNE